MGRVRLRDPGRHPEAPAATRRGTGKDLLAPAKDRQVVDR